jgi:hypothetical protein
MTNKVVVKDFLNALESHASDEGGLPYAMNYLSGLLRELDLQDHKEEILKYHTRFINKLINKSFDKS